MKADEGRRRAGRGDAPQPRRRARSATASRGRGARRPSRRRAGRGQGARRRGRQALRLGHHGRHRRRGARRHRRRARPAQHRCSTSRSRSSATVEVPVRLHAEVVVPARRRRRRASSASGPPRERALRISRRAGSSAGQGIDVVPLWSDARVHPARHPQAWGKPGPQIPKRKPGFAAIDPQAGCRTLPRLTAHERSGGGRVGSGPDRLMPFGVRRPGGSRRTTSRPRSRCSARCCSPATRSPPRSRPGSTPSDFYKPAHGHIYDAVQSLYGQGEPVDPVTVAEELRRADLLDVARRPAALLRSRPRRPRRRTPGTTRKIVAELALLRRLIAVAGDIAEMGYDAPDDVAETLDRAEALVFEVAETPRLRLAGRRLRRARSDTLDQLEALYGDDADAHRRPHRLQRPRRPPPRAPAVDPRDRRGPPGHGQDQRSRSARRANVAMSSRQAGHLLLDGDGHLELTKRLLAAEARVDARKLADRQAHRGRLDAAQPRGRPARRGAALHRRQPALHGHGDAGQGPAHQGPLRRPRPHRRRLPAAHDAEHVEARREPPGRGVGDLPRPEDPRPRARLPGDGAVAAQPPARVPPGQAADARRPP